MTETANAQRYSVVIIQRTGANGLAYVYDAELGHNERVLSGPDAVTKAVELAAGLNAPEPQRPDPTKTGPCALQLSFACTGAGYERLDPRDMLTPETSFRTPVIICLTCFEMAADHYLKELHR